MFTRLNPNASASVTQTAAAIEPAASGSVQPEFLRVPDVQRIFGIKRGMLYTLIGSGAVKSICLRQQGCKTGVRLVSYASLRDYCHKRLA